MVRSGPPTPDEKRAAFPEYLAATTRGTYGDYPPDQIAIELVQSQYPRTSVSCSSTTVFQARARPHGSDMGYAFGVLATHANVCLHDDHPNEHLVSVGGRNVPAHRREDKA